MNETAGPSAEHRQVTAAIDNLQVRGDDQRVGWHFSVSVTFGKACEEIAWGFDFDVFASGIGQWGNRPESLIEAERREMVITKHLSHTSPDQLGKIHV